MQRSLSRYLHLNPVRAGMVDRPEAWEWSSYRDYIGQRGASEWLRTGVILVSYNFSLYNF